jgi:superfamily II DNA or RNA helicase
MDNSTIVGDAVEYYQQHVPGSRALVFMWSIDSSTTLAERFRAAGVAAMHVDGETPAAERADTMRRFRAGDVRVICSVDIFGEGIDVPAVDAVFLCRPTQSLGLYLQQIGRGLRMSPGKTAVQVFDHAGNWTRHGLPDAPREWTLEDTPKKKVAIASGRRCMHCHAVSPVGAEVCVACQVPFPVTPRKMAQVDGTLAEWRARSDALVQETRAHPHQLAYWQAIGAARGYKRGWAYWRWREQLGKRVGVSL